MNNMKEARRIGTSFRYSERGARPSGKDSGNFFTYVQRAERIFGDTEEIRKPVKKHMAKIKRALKKPHN